MKEFFEKIIMGTKCYQALRKRYDEMEKSIKRINKIREKYKQGVKDIKNILKGYKQKNKKDLLESLAEVIEICKKIGE